MNITVTLPEETWNSLMQQLNALPYGLIFPLTPVLQEIAKQGREQYEAPHDEAKSDEKIVPA